MAFLCTCALPCHISFLSSASVPGMMRRWYPLIPWSLVHWSLIVLLHSDIDVMFGMVRLQYWKDQVLGAQVRLFFSAYWWHRILEEIVLVPKDGDLRQIVMKEPRVSKLSIQPGSRKMCQDLKQILGKLVWSVLLLVSCLSVIYAGEWRQSIRGLQVYSSH